MLDSLSQMSRQCLHMQYRLLQSFQSKLEEITIVALPEEMHNGQAGKAVQIHSYWDPAKSELRTLQILLVKISVHRNIMPFCQ